ncbi:T9SS type A sorting domain-containing protein [Winogradskyella sp. PAMC22761]|nr:T9SS type A sorting domain-containing protein [Winogradskyella sp. PAMC22761]
MKKTLLFGASLFIASLGYAQVQPVVHNGTFDKIAKNAGTDCSCSGWINKSIADQAESSTLNEEELIKLDDFESDGIYQEVAVVAGNDYTIDLEYTYKEAESTTNYLEVIVLKGSAYDDGYTPLYAIPSLAEQDGFGYSTVADVENADNQVAYTTIVPPGNTDTNNMTQLTFNTGTETSIAIFVRAVGPYDAALHGDSGKDKGWMNGDSEVRVDNLQLVNVTSLSTEDYFASSLKVYPNPAKSVLNIVSVDDANIDSVEIFNLLGKNVLSTSNLNNSAVDVSQLATGVYLLKINSGINFVTKRIVIE